MSVEERIRHAIDQYVGLVLLHSDFCGMGSASQVGKVLSRLVRAGVLVRVSNGAYAKTRINKFTGLPAAAGTLEQISAELFRRLGIEVRASRLVGAYNKGETTQVPCRAVVSTGLRRITRKVTVGNRTLVYEGSVRPSRS